MIIVLLTILQFPGVFPELEKDICRVNGQDKCWGAPDLYVILEEGDMLPQATILG